MQNAASLSLSLDANSLLIVPPGFNTATGFGSLVCLGLTHTAGTTLTVPAGQGFGGWGSISDPVVCQGTIAAGSGGFVNLNNGLTLSGSGTVSLGSGNLTNNDLVSGISGGTLSSASQYVGTSGTAAFTQSAGINTRQHALSRL